MLRPSGNCSSRQALRTLLRCPLLPRPILSTFAATGEYSSQSSRKNQLDHKVASRQRPQNRRPKLSIVCAFPHRPLSVSPFTPHRFCLRHHVFAVISSEHAPTRFILFVPQWKTPFCFSCNRRNGSRKSDLPAP